jgi:2-polyprenyl-3-methyl-5-hydroxy-6-metoxy-1,4-benzoquinol methylase
MTGGDVKDDVPEIFWETTARTKIVSCLTSVQMAFSLKSMNFSECHLVGDIGAGAGKFSLLVAERNVDVVAIDVDLPRIKRLKFKKKLIDVVQADARNIPLREGHSQRSFYDGSYRLYTRI